MKCLLILSLKPEGHNNLSIGSIWDRIAVSCDFWLQETIVSSTAGHWLLTLLRHSIPGTTALWFIHDSNFSPPNYSSMFWHQSHSSTQTRPCWASPGNAGREWMDNYTDRWELACQFIWIWVTSDFIPSKDMSCNSIQCLQAAEFPWRKNSIAECWMWRLCLPLVQASALDLWNRWQQGRQGFLQLFSFTIPSWRSKLKMKWADC